MVRLPSSAKGMLSDELPPLEPGWGDEGGCGDEEVEEEVEEGVVLVVAVGGGWATGCVT